MSEEKTNTEKAGAEPGDKTAQADSSTAAEKDDKKAASSTEGEPWHKDPRFKQDLGLLKAAKSLMERNGIETVDDLVELAESGTKVRGKAVDLDRLDEIVAKAAKLDQYQSYWAEQEELKRRGTETSDETIARLEREIKQREHNERAKTAQQQQAENAKQAIKSYEREVESLISEVEIGKEEKGFVLQLFGVGNPFNDIDITDRKAIKKMVADGIKAKEAYDQAVIKAYIDGKKATPKVASSSAAAETKSEKKIFLADARKALAEGMQKLTGG